MSASTSDQIRTHRYPAVLLVAVCLLAASTVLGAIPYNTLLTIFTPPGPRWYFMPYHPMRWIGPSLMVVFGICLLRGFLWSRYAVAILVVAMLFLQLGTGLGIQLHNFSAAVARDLVCAVFQLVAIAILFLPSSNEWFRRRAERSAA